MEINAFSFIFSNSGSYFYNDKAMKQLANQANFNIKLTIFIFTLLIIGVIVLIVVLTRSNSSGCQDDKDKYCSMGNSNTMCQYCGIDEVSCFESVIRSELTEDEKAEIVAKHNELRSKVANGEESSQPSARNMKKLKWNDELAMIAQRWANQCPQNHDENRMSPDFDHDPGQNMANIWTSHQEEVDLQQRIEDWYSEIVHFPSQNVGSFSQDGATGVIGHYTQLVWAETEFIGCGLINYRDQNQPDISFRYTLVCNYFPSGNWLGEPVYNSGTTASECRDEVENGLCI